MDFENKSLKGQMRRANNLGITSVIILFDDKIKDGIFIFKDMRNGNQMESEIDKFEQFLSILDGN